MLIRYSKNPVKAFVGIVYYNIGGIILLLLFNSAAYFLFHYLGFDALHLPVAPVTILGSALGFFLAFRNNSAYDRWWEARKIWGGIVNASRSFSMKVLTFLKNEEKPEVRKAQERLIHNHIAWLKALTLHLRKMAEPDPINRELESEDHDSILNAKNIPNIILFKQGQLLEKCFLDGNLSDYKHVELAKSLEELYALQGKAERIKNTVFPYYYNFFTRFFLWLFIFLLPFAIVRDVDFMVIPLGTAISFVFYILDKSGRTTEDPFENRATDTPMTSLTRTIEIDLLQHLGEENLPEPAGWELTKFGAPYMK